MLQSVSSDDFRSGILLHILYSFVYPQVGIIIRTPVRFIGFTVHFITILYCSICYLGFIFFSLFFTFFFNFISFFSFCFLLSFFVFLIVLSIFFIFLSFLISFFIFFCFICFFCFFYVFFLFYTLKHTATFVGFTHWLLENNSILRIVIVWDQH